MRICVVTSLAAAAEPRGPRHAVAAKQAFPEAEVVFVDMQPDGSPSPDPPTLVEAPQVQRQTIRYPVRKASPLALAWRKLRVAAARRWFQATGQVTEPVFGAAVVGLGSRLQALKADLYIAHNIETLLPAARAAQASGGRLIFDCMEYYADMGDSQPAVEARAAKRLQAAWLPRCALVTASSEVLADMLAAEYAIPAPLALYNTPPPLHALERPKRTGLSLYWRNAVVGFGQRGLEDMLIALTSLPADVTLTVQGRPALDGGKAVRDRVAELGLSDRVTILPPFPAGEAVAQASRHDIGLCLERAGPVNHACTVSNKLFDFMMAGLAVVVADLPGLALVVRRSQAGLLFAPGSADDLAARIADLRADPTLLATLSANARRFALAEGNVEVDMARFRAALDGLAVRREHLG